VATAVLARLRVHWALDMMVCVRAEATNARNLRASSSSSSLLCFSVVLLHEHQRWCRYGRKDHKETSQLELLLLPQR